MLFSGPLANRFVGLVADTSITPNQVTWISLVLALVAAGLYWQASPAAFLAGALLVQVAFALDCADGQLARFRQQGNPIGAWFDQIADRTREFALLLGIVAGYHRVTGDDTVWLLGFAVFFILWMLEYYSQQRWQIPDPEDRPRSAESRLSESGAKGFDQLEGSIDKFLPIAGFRVGEQLLFVSLFGIVAAGLGSAEPMKWLLWSMLLLGGAHLVYRPAKRLRAYYKWMDRSRTEEERT